MMNPMYLKDMMKDLIDIYSKSDKIFKFIHIPVQSGSEKVLRKMKRGHTAKTFKDIVRQFREKIPDMTIATDIITGYPEETDEDFELTLKMIKETEPDIVNSSRFSPRPGTLASKSKSIGQEIMAQRSEKLHRIIKNIAKKRNSRWLNWKGDVLIDEADGEKMKGRNLYYKSVIIKNLNENKSIDSICNSSNNENYSRSLGDLYSMRLNNHHDNFFLGKTIMVRVTGYSNHTLEGIMIT